MVYISTIYGPNFLALGDLGLKEWFQGNTIHKDILRLIVQLSEIQNAVPYDQSYLARPQCYIKIYVKNHIWKHKKIYLYRAPNDGHQYWRSERTEIKNHRGKMISPAISRSTPMERHRLIGPGMRSCGWGAGHVIPHRIQCAKGKKRLNPNFTAPSPLFVDALSLLGLR